MTKRETWAGVLTTLAMISDIAPLFGYLDLPIAPLLMFSALRLLKPDAQNKQITKVVDLASWIYLEIAAFSIFSTAFTMLVESNWDNYWIINIISILSAILTCSVIIPYSMIDVAKYDSKTQTWFNTIITIIIARSMARSLDWCELYLWYEIPFIYITATVLMIIGWWKLIRSGIFRGDYEGQNLKTGTHKLLNRYTYIAVGVLAITNILMLLI